MNRIESATSGLSEEPLGDRYETLFVASFDKNNDAKFMLTELDIDPDKQELRSLFVYEDPVFIYRITRGFKQIQFAFAQRVLRTLSSESLAPYFENYDKDDTICVFARNTKRPVAPLEQRRTSPDTGFLLMTIESFIEKNPRFFGTTADIRIAGTEYRVTVRFPPYPAYLHKKIMDPLIHGCPSYIQNTTFFWTVITYRENFKAMFSERKPPSSGYTLTLGPPGSLQRTGLLKAGKCFEPGHCVSSVNKTIMMRPGACGRTGALSLQDYATVALNNLDDPSVISEIMLSDDTIARLEKSDVCLEADVICYVILNDVMRRVLVYQDLLATDPATNPYTVIPCSYEPARSCQESWSRPIRTYYETVIRPIFEEAKTRGFFAPVDDSPTKWNPVPRRGHWYY